MARERLRRHINRRKAGVGPRELVPFDEVAPQVRSYLHNLVVRGWLDTRKLDADTTPDAVMPLLRSLVGPINSQPPVSAALRKRVELFRRREVVQTPPPLGSRFGANVALLSERLGFSANERLVLEFLFAGGVDSAVSNYLLDFPVDGREALGGFLADACGLSRPEGRALVRLGGPLEQAGLLAGEAQAYTDPSEMVARYMLSFPRALFSLLCGEGLDDDALVSSTARRVPTGTLSLADFAHLGPDLDLALKLVTAAAEGRQPGVHLLLHGPTGTGKTTVAEAICRAAGLPLYAVSSTSGSGDPVGPRGRVTLLRITQAMLRGARAVIMFDEMEDFVAAQQAGGDREGGTKGSLTQFFESAPVPMLWTTNDVTGLDPAYRRRLTFSIEMKTPGATTREQVLRKLAPELAANDDAIPRRLAERFEASPAELASAVRAARLVDGGTAAVPTLERMLVASRSLVAGVRVPAVSVDPGYYKVEAVNASLDVVTLAARLAEPAVHRLGARLLFSGRPGTGKSAYARQLAKRLGRPLLVKRTSDLLSKWVGETEANLAAAFEEAVREHALLLLDEADSLLRDRREARASWEVTQVNELLQQLETFTGLVACTTNFAGQLDPAAARRFDLRVEFRPPTPDQSWTLFETILGPLVAEPLPAVEDEVRRALSRLPWLTAGEFVAVARGLRLMADRLPVTVLLQQLAERRPEGVPRPIGFAA